MNDLELKEVGVMAERLARRYQTSQASQRDLVNAALLTALECTSSYSPEKGPFKAYACGAMHRTVAALSYTMTSPVTVGRYTGQRWPSFGRCQVNENEASGEAATDDRLHDLRLRKQVLARLLELLRGVHNGALAEAVLLGEQPPRKVAAAKRVPLTKVYEASMRGKRAVREDKYIKQLWKELCK